MAAKSLAPGLSIPFDHLELAGVRITQAQAIARVLHIILTNRLADHGEDVNDVILARLCWTAGDLLEMAYHEVSFPEQ